MEIKENDEQATPMNMIYTDNKMLERGSGGAGAWDGGGSTRTGTALRATRARVAGGMTTAPEGRGRMMAHGEGTAHVVFVL